MPPQPIQDDFYPVVEETREEKVKLKDLMIMMMILMMIIMSHSDDYHSDDDDDDG